jgi:hypothetical protein
VSGLISLLKTPTTRIVPEQLTAQREWIFFWRLAASYYHLFALVRSAEPLVMKLSSYGTEIAAWLSNVARMMIQERHSFHVSFHLWIIELVFGAEDTEI